jgi:hypothetical protein
MWLFQRTCRHSGSCRVQLRHYLALLWLTGNAPQGSTATQCNAAQQTDYSTCLGSQQHTCSCGTPLDSSTVNHSFAACEVLVNISGEPACL